MTEDFAKLFHFEDLGQVLITLDHTESGPCLTTRIGGFHSVHPSMSLGPFTDDEAGWSLARKGFDKITEEDARQGGEALLEVIHETVGKMVPANGSVN